MSPHAFPSANRPEETSGTTGRRRSRGRLAAACLAAAALTTTLTTTVAGPTSAAESSTTTRASEIAATAPQARAKKRTWLRSVRSDQPVALLRGDKDMVTGKVVGTTKGSTTGAKMPSGAAATQYDGRGAFTAFPSRPAYSIATTGQLTVEYWMRPDVLDFPDTEGSGYVYVLGKGDPGRHEWYGRMYSKRNSENRPNRISGYAFNPKGGLGAGSYVQDAVRPGEWIHVTLVFDARKRSGYPMGTVQLYKNGVLRDTDGLDGYDITPRAGSAPFRVGTGYLGSYFKGAVGDIVFYDRALGAAAIKEHHAAMPR